MRKIISTILVLVMVLSLFTSFGANAAHWAQEALDFVTENGYWIAPTAIEPDRPATRAETASLFARILISKIPDYNGAYSDVSYDDLYGGDITAVTLMGLMEGYDGEFRPNDTLTREELACILDRAAKMISDEFVDTTYNMRYYKDGGDVSDWASQSVQNASAYVLMKGIQGKLFLPKGTTTLAEVATVVKALSDTSDAEKEANQTMYSVRDITSSDNITKDFNVLQSGGINLQLGKGGFGMMARFNGAPGEIYISRKITNKTFDKDYGFAFPSVICRITDPNGNVVVRVNMYYQEDGTMEKIINIPEGDPGIYRIQFISGWKNDIMTIGVKNPVSWGVYGQSDFYFTETTPKKSYFWVPWKYETISLGIAGKDAKATVWSEDGTVRIAETAVSTAITNSGKKNVDIKSFQPDTVYMLEVPSNFAGVFAMIGGSKLLCPTPEMARDLKGGYTLYEDEYATLQLRGPLQIRARQRMIEIWEEMGADAANFKITVDKGPVPEVGSLDNPIAEAQMFSNYKGGLTNIQNGMDMQILDPSNPWFGTGANLLNGQETPELNWQEGYYHGGGYRQASGMTSALTTNAEINKYYGNPILQKRQELAWLFFVLQLEDTMAFYYSNPEGAALNWYFHQKENFQIGEQLVAAGYYHQRLFLSPKTRAITDNGMHQTLEIMNQLRGQGVTNQALMCMEGTLYTWMWTQEEYMHDDLANKIDGIIYPSTQPDYIGQTSPLGYWQEGSGSDGSSYGRMCEGMWDTIALVYLNLPKDQQRPEVVADIMEGTNRFLLFDSMWYAPAINGFNSRRTTAWLGRTNNPYGGQSAIDGNAFIQNIFPRAKRNHDIMIAGTEDPDTYISIPNGTHTAASRIINEATAYQHIANMWDQYDGCANPSKPTSYVGTTCWLMYQVMHLDGQWYDNSEIPLLPFELPGDYNVYDPEGGAIALKHKGLYLATFYDNDLNVVSGPSWYTAAPCQFWDDYFGTIMVSQKPASYSLLKGSNQKRGAAALDYRSVFIEDELVHMGIMGKDAGGVLFAEGRGKNTFSWIEEGKSFAIEHYDLYSLRKSTWKYYMTDEGYEFEVGMDSVNEREDLWVNIPCVDISVDVADASLTYSDEANTLTWAHNDKSTTISWDESVESRYRAKLGETSEYRFLQLKLTKNNPVVRFKITRDMNGYVYEPIVRQ